MLKKLRNVTYYVSDLIAAKAWYSQTFDIEPYFDEVYYVGFDIGGYELALHPAEEDTKPANSIITYWLVDDVKSSFLQLKEKGVEVHEEPNEVGGGIIAGSIKDPYGNIIGLISIPGE